MVALLSSVWGQLECFVLCSFSMPSFLWNGNGRPVSCGNRTLAPETNRVSDGSRPPKSWQPSQHSVWIMGNTRGLLLLCSLTCLKLIRCTLLIHPLCTLFIHPLCTLFIHPLCTLFIHPLCTLLIHPLFTLLIHPLCNLLIHPLCTLLIHPLFTLLIVHPTHSPTVHPTHSPTVHPPLCTLKIIREICDAHHLKVGTSTGGIKSWMLHTVLFTLQSPAHNALWAGGKTPCWRQGSQWWHHDADRAGGKTYHAKGQEANDDTVVQTGLVGRLAMLKANDDTVVQTGPVGRLTMLKARRPMMMPWCRQGQWEDLPR